MQILSWFSSGCWSVCYFWWEIKEAVYSLLVHHFICPQWSPQHFHFSLFTPNWLLTCDWNHGLKVWKPLKFCNSWITKHSSLVFPHIFFVAYTQNNYLVLIYARWFIFDIFQDKLQLILVWYVIGILCYQYTILYCSSNF